MNIHKIIRLAEACSDDRELGSAIRRMVDEFHAEKAREKHRRWLAMQVQKVPLDRARQDVEIALMYLRGDRMKTLCQYALSIGRTKNTVRQSIVRALRAASHYDRRILNHINGVHVAHLKELPDEGKDGIRTAMKRYLSDMEAAHAD